MVVKYASKKRQKGNAIIEFAMIMPLLFPLVLVTFDFGLYAYAFISVQNAARVAALRNSGGIDSAADQAGACSIVTDELRGMPNISSSFSSNCGADPLAVTAVLLCPNPSSCSGSLASPDNQPAAQVTVQYNIPGVFRFPLVGPQKITRVSQMKMRAIQ